MTKKDKLIQLALDDTIKQSGIEKMKGKKPKTSHKKVRKSKYFTSRSRIKAPYMTKDGERVPGVTTVAGILEKPALQYWAWDLGRRGIDYRKHRDVLADVGMLAHEMILAYFLGLEVDLYEFSEWVIERAKNSFDSFLNFTKKYKLKPKNVEREIISEKLRVGGRIDFHGDMDDASTIIDFKTGKRVYDDYFIQLGGYGLLLAEEGELIEKHVIVNVPRSKEETFQVAIRRNIQLEKKIFRACLEIYHERKKIKADEMITLSS